MRAPRAERNRRWGAVMYVEDTGQGPPVLAVPGLGGGAWFFAGLAKRLSATHRVLSVDLPGTWRSPADGRPVSTARWLEDLEDLLIARVAEPITLVGHSLGTILALQAWRAWPHRIRGLVFVGGLPRARPLIRERLSQRANAVSASGLAGWGARAASGNFARATLEGQPELVALFERLFEAQDAQQYVHCCHVLLSASAEEIVPTVTASCLAITGSEDQYAPPELVRTFADQLPVTCGVEVLSGCGHLPFLEAPEAFAGVVRSFLASL